MSRFKQKKRWSDYPVGTVVTAIMGGHWYRTKRGWKWGGPNGTGGTFPTPGGDWSEIIEPEKPLFIPLKTEFYEAFCNGSKEWEYRLYGPRWNERTCKVGRQVTISKGYGRHARRTGVITKFKKRYIDTKAFVSCYGFGATAACIRIQLDTPITQESETKTAVYRRTRFNGAIT